MTNFAKLKMKKMNWNLNASAAHLAENRWISRLRFQLWIRPRQPPAVMTHSRCFHQNTSKFRLQLIRESAHHMCFCDLNVKKMQNFLAKLIRENNNSKKEMNPEALLGQLIFPLAGILRQQRKASPLHFCWLSTLSSELFPSAATHISASSNQANTVSTPSDSQAHQGKVVGCFFPP